MELAAHRSLVASQNLVLQFTCLLTLLLSLSFHGICDILPDYNTTKLLWLKVHMLEF